MGKEYGTGTMPQSRSCDGGQKSEDDQAVRLLQKFQDVRAREHSGAEGEIRSCRCSRIKPVRASAPLPDQPHLPIGKHGLDSDISINQQSMLGVAFQEQY
jgi:hypothetical protein